VKFSIDFIKQCGPGVAWNYPLVMDVNSTTIVDDYTIKVRLNSYSFWGLHMVGSLPIIPKHIWEGIKDSQGLTWTDPDWDPMSVREFHPWEAANGMVGTGPWIFQSWVTGETVLLKANRNYYRSASDVEKIIDNAFHGVGDVDYNRLIDIKDLSMIARALGTDSSMPKGTGWDQWNPACDLNNDGKVDLKDLFLAGQNFGMVTG
jgi:ABC-type transport system substrate-binding protein